MPEITKRNLVLTFETKEGKEIKLTLVKPREGMTGEEIGAAMDAIVTAGVLGENGIVATKTKAAYVVEETQVIELA